MLVIVIESTCGWSSLTAPERTGIACVERRLPRTPNHSRTCEPPTCEVSSFTVTRKFATNNQQRPWSGARRGGRRGVHTRRPRCRARTWPRRRPMAAARSPNLRRAHSRPHQRVRTPPDRLRVPSNSRVTAAEPKSGRRLSTGAAVGKEVQCASRRLVALRSSISCLLEQR